MSVKKIFLKYKLSYKLYLYYNLYLRNKCLIKRDYYSQWGEDLIIKEFFKDKKNGNYLDIGCYHPFMYSNTCLLHQKGWEGINIDINPTSIDLFKIARPKDINICTSLSKKKDNFKVYYDDPFSPLNTLDQKFYQQSKGKFFKNMKEFSIQSKTFQEVISLSKSLNTIDFVNIDVEGLDYEILKQLEITQYKVKLICIETHNVNGTETKNFDLVKEFLKKCNFSVYKRIGPSTLFSNNN